MTVELKHNQVILVGPHSVSKNLVGFYATVETYNHDKMHIAYRDPFERAWDKAGHGKTPAEAIADLEKVLKTGRSRRKVSTFIRKGSV